MTATPTNGNPLKPGRWSAMPTWFVERGILGLLTRSSTARAFIAMVAAARWSEGGLVKRSAEQLAKDAGLSPKSILRARRELARFGLVDRVSHGGGKAGDAAEYRIAVHVERDQNRTLLSACAGENWTELSASEVDNGDPRRGQRGPQKRTTGTPEVDTACPPLQSRESRAAEGAADLDPGILDALVVAGIGEPTRSRLAALPGLTVRMVNDEAEKVSCRANILNKPAVIAINIQARIQQERVRQANQTTLELRHQGEREREREAARQAESQTTDDLAAIEAMPDEELAERVSVVLQRADMHARRWGQQAKRDGVRQAVRTNRGLRIAVLAVRRGCEREAILV